MATPEVVESGLLDLLTVDLSNRASVQLVERVDVDAVLREM
jgi:hypothetical protein